MPLPVPLTLCQEAPFLGKKRATHWGGGGQSLPTAPKEGKPIRWQELLLGGFIQQKGFRFGGGNPESAVDGVNRGVQLSHKMQRVPLISGPQSNCRRRSPGKWLVRHLPWVGRFGPTYPAQAEIPGTPRVTVRGSEQYTWG